MNKADCLECDETHLFFLFHSCRWKSPISFKLKCSTMSYSSYFLAPKKYLAYQQCCLFQSKWPQTKDILSQILASESSHTKTVQLCQEDWLINEKEICWSRGRLCVCSLKLRDSLDQALCKCDSSVHQYPVPLEIRDSFGETTVIRPWWISR